VFVQGLVLAPPERVPARLQALRPALEAFHAFAAERETSPALAALAFAAAVEGIDVALVGVNSASQLEEMGLWQRLSIRLEEFHRLALNDASLLDPRHWPRQGAEV
jgi:aryl-alcohol dehydrogenase-like predicted oxidoreductase